MNATGVRFDPLSGLAPAIVQDASTRRVLMLGYVNAESLRMTTETGFVHFWSRSRNELWRKGATSDNTLRVVDSAYDCDRDALLYLVDPAGPTCHDGGWQQPRPELFAPLAELWSVIERRKADRPDGSYTAELVSRGVDGIGRKIVEEATEVLLAARDHTANGDATPVYEEAADLIYHLFVLLAERNLEPRGFLDVLENRASAG